MAPTARNPFAGLTIEQFAGHLRRRAISAEAATAMFLERIDRLDPRLGAYTFVDAERALAGARTADRLLRSGTDLGLLMGVPVAVKDLFYVAGTPLTAGSHIDVSRLVTAEGPFIQALRDAGCIILGKTWTSEFALGGINFVQRVPWNPWNASVHLTPGGSSGGSAVAMSAGLCAFAIGSDTGGSVRMPAALCGVVGHKFSSTAFSLRGVFPLSPTLDSIGTLTASAADAATVFSVLKGQAVAPLALKGLRFGSPQNIFFEDLDAAVSSAIGEAMQRLTAAGAEIIPMNIPELAEVEAVFGRIVPFELIALIGRDRLAREKDQLDPVSRARFEAVWNLPRQEYLDACTRQAELTNLIAARMRDVDAWITPTTPLPAAPLANYPDFEAAGYWNRRALRNTRPGNLFGQCGISLPLPGMSLPVGLHLACPSSHDGKLLAIAQAVEVVLGRAALPDFSVVDKSVR